MSTPTCVSIDDLDPEHRDALTNAVHKVLSTGLALETYAQIIDGVPLCEVAWDRYEHRLHKDHPVNSHKDLCPGALETARSMRDEMDIRSLSFEAKLLQSYQSAETLSQSFRLRLLELIAITLHQIAVHLFQKDTRLHDQYHPSESSLSIESITNWRRPPSQWLTITPWATLFAHPGFTCQDQYPNGVADMVGYWAEDRILGGVVLFDHSKDYGSGYEEPNAYFQSSRPKRTYMIYQLTDSQQEALLEFMLQPLAGDGSRQDYPCPLPLSSSHENKNKIDPEFAITKHNIYRDVWERPAPRPFQQLIRNRDVLDPTENPGAADEELKRLRETGF